MASKKPASFTLSAGVERPACVSIDDRNLAGLRGEDAHGPFVLDAVRPEKRERIAVGGGEDGVEFGAVERESGAISWARGWEGYGSPRGDAIEIALAGSVGPPPAGERAHMAHELLLFGGMQALRLVMLLAALPVCYLLFYHPKSASQMILDNAAKIDSALSSPTPDAHSEYKRDLDKARDAARQMQAQYKPRRTPSSMDAAHAARATFICPQISANFWRLERGYRGKSLLPAICRNLRNLRTICCRSAVTRPLRNVVGCFPYGISSLPRTIHRRATRRRPSPN